MNPDATINTILGIKKDAIRKAYFNHTLNDLLDTIQANEQVSEEGLQELTLYLQELEAEKTIVRKGLVQYTGEEIEPPTVANLYEEDTSEEFKAWFETAKKTETYVKSLMRQTAEKAHTGGLNIESLKDSLLLIEAGKHYLDELRVYYDQKYRARITEIIDTTACSRKESEERAKLTPEYRNYKTAVLFDTNVESFIMTAKKKIGNAY